MTSNLINHTVYSGHIDIETNSYVFDDIDLSFESSISLNDDMGYTTGDEIIFYVISVDETDEFINDLLGVYISWGAYYIDFDNNFILEESDTGYPLSFQNGEYNIFVSYIAGMGYPEYDNSEVIINNNSYTWTLYTNLTPQNTVIATATAIVINGRAETSNITYTDGMSRNSLIPGHTYTVTATYSENDLYNSSVGSGTLEMLKCPTVTTISGVTKVVVGDSVTLTVRVWETINHTLIQRGNVRIYDGENIIQNNYTLTGESTIITFTPTTTGVHNISAVFTDSGVEYNSSNSNVLSINVFKKNSSISSNIDSINTTLGTPTVISGVLSCKGTGLSDSNVSLLHYNGNILETTSTDSNGSFSFNYIPNEVMVDKNLTLRYEGTNLIDSSEKNITANISPHNTTLTYTPVNGYINNIIDLTVLLTDEHNENVIEGIIEWTIQLG